MFRVTTVIATECSLLQESYCSNSKKKKKLELERLLEAFLCVYFPKLALESLLEML